MPASEPAPARAEGRDRSLATTIERRLAETLVGEIISVDSMQVYRGLDIGTAKPSAPERKRVPHHLLDVVGVTEPFDVRQE